MTHDGVEGEVTGPVSPSSRGSGTGSALGRQLRGDLPCVACGYNLKGLSIRSVCPECGTPVRATILSVVDPHAAELTPIRLPALVALGLLFCAAGALGA